MLRVADKMERVREARTWRETGVTGEKLPAVIIFKERGGVLGVRVKKNLRVPENVRVRASTNGWMTAPEYRH